MNGKRAKALRKVSKILGIPLKDIKRIDNRLTHKQKAVYTAKAISSTVGD